MNESFMNRWTLILCIAAILILILVRPADAAGDAWPGGSGYSLPVAIGIAVAVQVAGWPAVPDSPHIGCMAPRPAPVRCWANLRSGGQIWFTESGWEVRK